MFGIQTPMIGGNDKLVEKVTANFDKITNVAPNMMPTARCNPIPPLTLREATTTPISVSINMVNGSAVLLYNSI